MTQSLPLRSWIVNGGLKDEKSRSRARLRGGSRKDSPYSSGIHGSFASKDSHKLTLGREVVAKKGRLISSLINLTNKSFLHLI